MSRYALDERSELADSLRSAGGDAPTLCGAWSTAQLATHLVLRERSWTEILGRVPAARLQAVAQRAIDRYVAAHSYATIVDTFAAGPPRWSPFAVPVLRENVNLVEYLIHHEDVRRAATSWQPRALPVDRQQAVWVGVRRAARLTLRPLPVPTRLVWPSHGSFQVGRGEARVSTTGDPVELALFAFGRERVAELDWTGAPDDVAAVRATDIAL